ncbi:NACHT domain-containing protein [Nocardia seriolae]|uniref:NACHT domain-containing protein n=1 Tax=Nocardia seriolae TaxID=37332 RepID=UPI001319E581|nr:NACHT domain-containing protein [Nocardia seriolae]
MQKSWKWAVAATGLPGLYATWLHDFAAQHPLRAGVLLLAYWAAITTAGFVWKAAKDPIDQARQGIAHRLTLTTGNILFRPGRRYRKHLLTTLDRIGSTGAFDLESNRPYFDDVYVSVELARSSPDAVPSDILAEGHRPRVERRITELLGPDSTGFSVVLGAAGFGKTTLSQHLVRELARTRRFPPRRAGRGRPPAGRGRVPILIPLSQWASRVAADPPVSLPEVATAGLADPDSPMAWLRSRLDAGRCVIVADGLDEIPEVDTRTAVIAWLIAARIGRSAINSVILTSRPDSYRSTPVTATPVDVAHIRKLSPQLTDHFIDARFRAFALADHGFHARLFAQQIRAPALTVLTVNPLLLTLMITLYRATLDRTSLPVLPTNRVEVYRRVFDLLVRRRVTSNMEAEQKFDFLRRTALTMMIARVTRIAIADIGSPGEAGPGNRRALVDALKSDGLVTEPVPGTLAFTHKTFQEYLAAVHIHKQGLARILLDQVASEGDWWRETILLFSGLGPYDGRAAAEPIIETCLRHRTSATALSTALAVNDQGRDIPEFLAFRLFQTVDDAADAEADTRFRRTVARALLDNHLNRPVAQPITARIHRLFVLDHGGDPVPDAPYPNDLGQPAYGIRAADAVDIVAWVNNLVDYATYRLPTIAEMTELDSPTERSPGGRNPEVRTIWIHSDSGLPQRLRKSLSNLEVDTVQSSPLTTTLERMLHTEDPGYYVRHHPELGGLLDIYPELQPLGEIDLALTETIAAALGPRWDGLGTSRRQPTRAASLTSVLATAIAADPGRIPPDPAETGHVLVELAARLPRTDEPLLLDLYDLVNEFGLSMFADAMSRLFAADSSTDNSRTDTWHEAFLRRARVDDPDFPLQLAFAVVGSASIEPGQRARAVTALRILAAVHSDPNQWSTRKLPSIPADLLGLWDGMKAANPGRSGAKAPLVEQLTDLAKSLATRVFRRFPAPIEGEAARLRDIALLLAPRCSREPELFTRWIDLATAAEDVRRRFGDRHAPDEMVVLVPDE